MLCDWWKKWTKIHLLKVWSINQSHNILSDVWNAFVGAFGINWLYDVDSLDSPEAVEQKYSESQCEHKQHTYDYHSHCQACLSFLSVIDDYCLAYCVMDLFFQLIKVRWVAIVGLLWFKSWFWYCYDWFAILCVANVLDVALRAVVAFIALITDVRVL